MSIQKKIAIGVVAVLILTAIVWYSLSQGRKNEISVETTAVEKMNELIALVTATGEIKPKEYVELQAEISGVITHLLVEEGDYVQKGDILLKIDPVQNEADTRAQEAILASSQAEARSQQAQISVQKTNVTRDEAAVRAAEVEVRNARQLLTLAKSIFERKQLLYEENLIAKETYESAKADLINAESNMATAEVRLEQARAQLEVSKVVLEQAKAAYDSALSRVKQQKAFLDRSRDLLSKTVIRSPLSGVITQMNVEVGERAVPGTLNNPAATLMIIADLSIIEAEVEVDETDIVDLQLGQSAVVKVDALPDTPLKGTVTEIGNSAIVRAGSNQEAKDFKVVIQLTDPPKALRPGLSCTGEITTAVKQDILAIPIQALTIRELPIDENGNVIRVEKKSESKKKSDDDAEGEKKDTEKKKQKHKEFEGVFRVADGKAEFVPVKSGIIGEAEIEIIEGLEEGQIIVTGNYKTLRTLKDGDAVKSENGKGA